MRNFILLSLLMLFIPLSAQAYIGPGLGVVAIWTLLGPIAAIVSVIAILAYFPLRYYYKKHKSKKAAQDSQTGVDEKE